MANFLFIGEETFLIEEALTRLKSSLGENAALNYTLLNAEDGCDIRSLIESCNTLPFLGEKRAVALRNVNKLKKDELARLSVYCADPADFCTLVMTVETPEAIKKALDGPLKPLAPHATAKRFDALKAGPLVQWISNRVAAGGKTIATDAAARLAELTGENLSLIAGEIEKLLTYVGAETAINKAAVETLVAATTEASLFKFSDALFQRRREALAELGDIERGASEPLALIGLLTSQTTQHYQVLIEGRAGGVNPYVAKKIEGRRRLWNASQLLDLLHELRAIETGIKTGRTDNPWAGLHWLTARVCIPKEKK